MPPNSNDSFIFNLCDKTWVLFDGVIPMTQKIPSYVYNKIIDSIKTRQFVYYLNVSVIIILFLIIMIGYLSNINKKAKIIYE